MQVIAQTLNGICLNTAVTFSSSFRGSSCGLNFKDDYIEITDYPDLSNTSSSTWQQNVSWETQEEFYTLSDAISKEDIMGLRPIFRKDLPRDYIAYWEAKINDKKGEKYVIISAGMYCFSRRDFCTVLKLGYFVLFMAV